MKVTAEIRKIIMEDGNALQISEVSAREGFGTIYESGLRKVISSATSLEEINRVTSGH
jgi:type IV pilus assembly protein PilB